MRIHNLFPFAERIVNLNWNKCSSNHARHKTFGRFNVTQLCALVSLLRLTSIFISFDFRLCNRYYPSDCIEIVWFYICTLLWFNQETNEEADRNTIKLSNNFDFLLMTKFLAYPKTDALETFWCIFYSFFSWSNFFILKIHLLELSLFVPNK